jgi:hypothetical protein
MNTEPEFLNFKEPQNRFQGTNSARPEQPYSYSVPSPHRLLKIPAQESQFEYK